jgi:hypothetical protein
MIPGKQRGLARLFAVALATLAILVVSAAPAFAADGITFTQPNQTVEYGQSWEVGGNITPQTSPDSDYGSLSVSTGSTTENLGTNQVYGGAFAFGDYSFDLALGAGTHSFSATFSGGSATAASGTPAVVKITPAPILTTTTISPDPNNSQNAIITSQLSGKYIDQLPNCECEDQDGYLLPAGTWKMTVTDSSGQTVLTKQLNQPASGLPTFVNYWQSVPAGETFSAQSTFTVAGSSAANFTLTSQKFSWTSKKVPGAGGVRSPSNSPRPKTVKTASFAPPLVIFYAALLVAIILVALDVLLLVSRRRSRRKTRVAAEGAGS